MLIDNRSWLTYQGSYTWRLGSSPTNATKYDLNTGGQMKTNIEIFETKIAKSDQRKWLRELTHDQKALILAMLMEARKEGYMEGVSNSRRFCLNGKEK